jgi:hypothetical protein
MKSKEYNHYRSSHTIRLLGWLLLCGSLVFTPLSSVMAAASVYENNGIVDDAYPPDIDATNFINNGSFTVDFTTISLVQPFYETSDTINYTNNGTMVANTGFQFDTQPTTGSEVRAMAGSFDNPGSVTCDSLDEAGFNAWATNIVNPGTVDVGSDGLMAFTGQNVNLTRSLLIMENNGGSSAGSGFFGTNIWDPGADLSANAAFTPFFDLFDSTAYIETNSTDGGTNNIIRAVFIEDNSTPNVAYSVYFNTADLGLGSGDVTIQWAGSYINPVTGIISTNYLYLNNDYVLGASTNVALINGVPDNFVFSEKNAPFQFPNGITPAPAGFIPALYAFGELTNSFSYGNIQLIATTESTNNIANRSITNLLARIEISASNELNLAHAQINTPNYLSIQAPHQFDGSPGALIQSPYSDLNLGVTNGFLTLSNILAPQLTNWSGGLQAYDTRWIEAVNGITNDYRVLVVGSDVDPVTLAQVQNLLLHSTNSIVISDALNVMSVVTADAQNLTLTTNGPGNGATSLDGELNVETANIFWASSFPNLLNLTNNGTIRLQNVNQFVGTSNGVSIPYDNFINSGLLSDQGSIIWANNFVDTGTITNGLNSFTLQSVTATLTNDFLYASGDISITADSLETSNMLLQAGRSLTINSTNLLTDDVPGGAGIVTNGNVWVVGGASSAGLNLLVKPASGDLLGTTITNIASFNKNVINIWAGTNYGDSASGYTNNAAIGRLILDAGTNGVFTFNGASTIPGVTNALYVDYLELRDQATNLDSHGNPIALTNSPNLVIYYAQAVMEGVSVAELLNRENNGHLLWVPAYAGHYSSTNLYYAGATNIINAALAQSRDIDSSGDGIPNANNSEPVFVSGQVDFGVIVTNVPPLKARITWNTIPDATNYVEYSTNLLSTNWITLTNFVTASAPPYAPVANVVYDAVTNSAAQKYYRVRINPNVTDLYGP